MPPQALFMPGSLLFLLHIVSLQGHCCLHSGPSLDLGLPYHDMSQAEAPEQCGEVGQSFLFYFQEPTPVIGLCGISCGRMCGFVSRSQLHPTPEPRKLHYLWIWGNRFSVPDSSASGTEMSLTFFGHVILILTSKTSCFICSCEDFIFIKIVDRSLLHLGCGWGGDPVTVYLSEEMFSYFYLLLPIFKLFPFLERTTFYSPNIPVSKPLDFLKV